MIALIHERSKVDRRRMCVSHEKIISPICSTFRQVHTFKLGALKWNIMALASQHSELGELRGLERALPLYRNAAYLSGDGVNPLRVNVMNSDRRFLNDFTEEGHLAD